MSYQKIFAALDRSPMGQIVFDRALAIAKQDNASLMLFHSIPLENHQINPYSSLYGEALINYSKTLQEQLDEQRQEINDWLADYCQLATDAAIPTEYDYKVGEAGRWIKDMAETWDADLIIIGRRGLTGLQEALLGSVSNYILHYASCSVLVLQGINQ